VTGAIGVTGDVGYSAYNNVTQLYYEGNLNTIQTFTNELIIGATDKIIIGAPLRPIHSYPVTDPLCKGYHLTSHPTKIEFQNTNIVANGGGAYVGLMTFATITLIPGCYLLYGHSTYLSVSAESNYGQISWSTTSEIDPNNVVQENIYAANQDIMLAVTCIVTPTVTTNYNLVGYRDVSGITERIYYSATRIA
jgi:hypothetical protein